MGMQCTRDKDQEVKPELPYYEVLCSEMEKRLIFPSLNIKELEAEVNAIKETQGRFTGKDIIQVYEKHGVPQKNFLAPGSIYQELLPDYNECDLGSQYLLSTALPFCQGNLSDKKDILWKLLQPQKEGVNRMVLKDIVRMIIVLCVKTIPEIALKDIEKRGNIVEDNDMILLIKSDDSSVKQYAENSYLKGLKDIREGHGVQNEQSLFVTRYEYDFWLVKINGDKLLTSSGNRQAFLAYIKSNPQDDNKIVE